MFAIRRAGSEAMKNTDRHAGTSERVPTLADVAREAGVAISTASRSFTNPPRVNARTRERIVEAADRLGYRPNALARALESGRTRTVGLVVSDITNPHFFGLIRGAEQQAATAGYTLVLADTRQSPERELEVIARISSF